MTSLAVRGGTVVGADRVRASIDVEDGRIRRIADSDHRDVAIGTIRIDATDASVLPGFIDLQVNGALGVDLTVEPERIGEVAEFLPSCGVTSWMPTIISSPLDQIAQGITTMHRWATDAETQALPVARSLGVHVEGPFLSPARRGAHPPQHLRLPTRRDVADWTTAAGVAMVTLAPELPGALDVVRTLVAAGITVCAGHTEAGPDVIESAAQAGLRGVTHLFNAMGTIGARSPGAAGASLAHPTLIAGLIVDGIHVDPTMVRLAWSALGPDRVALVTDAMAALGLPHGSSAIGDTSVIVDETGAHTSDGTLAGSVLRFDRAVCNLMRFTGCDLAAASRAASTTPARLAGRTDVGHLAVGATADLVVVDDDLRVLVTVVGGHVVWDPDGRVSGLRTPRRAPGGVSTWRS